MIEGDKFYDDFRGISLKIIEIRDGGQKPITVEYTVKDTGEKGRGDTTADWLKTNCTKVNNDPFTKDKGKLKI